MRPMCWARPISSMIVPDFETDGAPALISRKRRDTGARSPRAEVGDLSSQFGGAWQSCGETRCRPRTRRPPRVDLRVGRGGYAQVHAETHRGATAPRIEEQQSVRCYSWRDVALSILRRGVSRGAGKQGAIRGATTERGGRRS